MAITATITNIVQEDTHLRVFVSYSDVRQPESFPFDSTAQKADVINVIHPIVQALNDAATKATAAQSLIGTVIS